MSKRHRKLRDMPNADGGYANDDMSVEHYDLSMYEAPKGKKPKGRQKRESHKRAYYDD